MRRNKPTSERTVPHRDNADVRWHPRNQRTFSKNRHGRFRESELLRHLFETTVARCIDGGLVGGESFGVDASLIPANANRTRGIDS